MRSFLQLGVLGVKPRLVTSDERARERIKRGGYTFFRSVRIPCDLFGPLVSPLLCECLLTACCQMSNA